MDQPLKKSETRKDYKGIYTKEYIKTRKDYKGISFYMDYKATEKQNEKTNKMKKQTIPLYKQNKKTSNTTLQIQKNMKKTSNTTLQIQKNKMNTTSTDTEK